MGTESLNGLTRLKKKKTKPNSSRLSFLPLVLYAGTSAGLEEALFKSQLFF